MPLSDIKVVTQTRPQFDTKVLEPSKKPIDMARHAPGDVYASPEVFALEKEKLFMQDWLCVGREEEIAKPGDYMTHSVMGEPIIIARNEAGVVNAFYNQCRHRGVEVAEGSGNTRRFMCPYHAWTYDLNGQLVGAAFMQETAGFDIKSCRLKPLRSETWKGWIYISFNPDIGPLADHVGFLDDAFGELRQEDCGLAYKFTLEMNCNWKLVYENQLDNYHVGVLHAATVGKHQSSPDRKFNLQPNGRLSVDYGSRPTTPDGVSLFGKMPWMAHQPDTFARTGFLPPNMTILSRMDMYRPFVHWPIAPDKTRSYGYFLLPKEKLQDPQLQEKMAVYVEYLKKVLDEDRSMVESLQRNMMTNGYEPGRFSTKEASIHHLMNHHLKRVFGADTK
jgi:phenylpropionate dioxygenase-like ring-hydroxylating dioxygenase large terminal subunit